MGHLMLVKPAQPIIRASMPVPSRKYCLAAAATFSQRSAGALPLLSADHLNMAKLPKTLFSQLHSNA